jgi:glycogen debranching enzyme
MHRYADDLRNLDRALATEWLLADGAGGYASSTVLLCPTRRYHGLWVPALRPPLGRHVILSHVDERLVTADGEAWLSTTEYPDAFHPDGSAQAAWFSYQASPPGAPMGPQLVSGGPGAAVGRQVSMFLEGAGVTVSYHMQGSGDWTLDLAPMLALRSMHHLGHKHDGFRVEPLDDAPGWRVLTEGLPGVFVWADSGNAEAGGEPTWYEGVLVRVERERGFDFTQDLLTPGRWTVCGRGEGRFRLCCSFDPPRPGERYHAVYHGIGLGRFPDTPDVQFGRLLGAACSFIVRRHVAGKDLQTIIAGYPWFADWGRDAMIALPGLTVEAGRPAEAAMVLEAFASAAADGLIPNRFGEESGRAEYNTVDASLWYLQALAAYVQWSGEQEVPHDPAWADHVRDHLWPVACEVVHRYAEGTRFGIHADSDGLILAGDATTQLTWMDARTSDGRPVTPRHGKAVEIQALWLSGLALMEEMAEALGLEPPEPCGLRADARAAFEALFWNEDAGCLYDCIGPDGSPDAAIRPNQIFAVGLPHAPLRGERAKAVVHTVRERLLTPRGLRTLDPADAAYIGVYRGGPDERDAAYHQGTAWPWLLGPYVDAVFAVECRECARGEAAQVLQALVDAMDEAGLGQISEVYDGDPPHRPGGCIAQAWSVAAAIHIRRRLAETGGVP